MRLAVLLCLIASPSFADGLQTENMTLSTPPTAWLGEAPHLVIMGRLNGRDVNIQLMDMNAPEIAEFSGKREYLPGEGGTFRYGDFEVGLKAVIGGVERSLELEFENDDFQTVAIPADLDLGPDNFPKGNAAYLEVSAEWEDSTGAVNDEIGAFSGTLTRALDEGTPDEKGLSGDGLIGGLVVAENAGEVLVISFTVPVSEYEIDD